MSQAEQKRRGPKPKPASEVKRNSFTLRMRDDMRAKLQAAADEAGRPMSEEAERRIEQSFEFERDFGNGTRLKVLHMIALSMDFAERLTGRRDYNAQIDFAAVRAAVIGTLDNLVNLPGILWASPEGIEAAERVGQASADVSQMHYQAKSGVPIAPLTPERRKSLHLVAALLQQNGELSLPAAAQGSTDEQADPEDQQRTAIFTEILRQASTSPDARPDDPEWRERMARVARDYPGGPVAMLNALVRHNHEHARAERLGGGPTLEGLMTDRKTKQEEHEG